LRGEVKGKVESVLDWTECDGDCRGELGRECGSKMSGIVGGEWSWKGGTKGCEKGWLERMDLENGKMERRMRTSRDYTVDLYIECEP
jgi:hypothetical protein